jgi:hypothetical protein
MLQVGDWKKRLLLRAAVVAVVMAIPLGVWAWKEGGAIGRLVMSGSGCIDQAHFVTHGDEHTSMVITGVAALAGVTRDPGSGRCNAYGFNRQIRGTHRLMLLYSPKDTDDPNQTYGICKLIDKTHAWTANSIKTEQSWSTPPCGEGWYALVYCMTDVDTYMQSNTGVKLGWYNAIDARTQCNVTPAWHPAIHGMGTQMGPRVIL